MSLGQKIIKEEIERQKILFSVEKNKIFRCHIKLKINSLKLDLTKLKV